MKTTKNLITWKDADQNLCTLAASILDEATKALRNADEIKTTWPCDDGTVIKGGMGTDGGKRTWWSGRSVEPRFDTFFRGPTPQCWWSFQNIVRQCIKDARQEIYNNLYQQRRKLKASDQNSRNPIKRPEKSKYGRQPERE